MVTFSRLPMLVAVALLAACTLPDIGGPRVEPTAPSAASSPPPGAVDPASDPVFAAFYQQKLTWEDCDDDYECADLTVPVDWNRSSGATLEVAVARLPAGEDAIGSLVVNPGGPGVSGIAYARVARQAFGRDVRRAFDVVGFDPRGIGESQPVECLADREMDEYVAEDASPDDAGELIQAVDSIRAFAAACQRNTGDLIEHVDTLSVARDMDVLRAALGEPVLNFHGVSYGTFLGAWYAETFPWRVGRFVLDGAVDPSLSSAEYTEGQTEGFTRVLRAYLGACLDDRGCPFRGTLEEALNQVGTLVARADRTPLRSESDRPLTQSLMITGIVQGLYDTQLWEQLSEGLEQALSGDGTGLLTLADLYLERDADGGYGQTLAANPAIFCLDSAETRSPDQIRTQAADLQKRFPPLGGALGWGSLGCAEWPVEAVLKRQPLTADGAAPILVVGTVDDPATPYEWAEGLAGQLSSGRLLTWEGHEHTAYGQGSACIDEAVEAYLLAGRMPGEGTRCPDVS